VEADGKQKHGFKVSRKKLDVIVNTPQQMTVKLKM
jgi:hypothetical protein